MQFKNYLNKHGYDSFDLRSVMFDMDGVLFDSMKNHARAWNETMLHFGFDLSYEEAFMHEGRTGASTINIVSMRERGHEATQQEIDDIYTYKSELFATLPEPDPMPGAYELLKKVQGCGLQPMVVTGSGQRSLLDRLEKNFPGIFTKEYIVSAYDVKIGKPDPEPYLMGLAKCASLTEGGQALSPFQSVVIENAPLGVRAGVAAGVFTVAVNTGPLPDSVLLDEGANLIYPSMASLAEAWSSLFLKFQS